MLDVSEEDLAQHTEPLASLLCMQMAKGAKG